MKDAINFDSLSSVVFLKIAAPSSSISDIRHYFTGYPCSTKNVIEFVLPPYSRAFAVGNIDGPSRLEISFNYKYFNQRKWTKKWVVGK